MKLVLELSHADIAWVNTSIVTAYNSYAHKKLSSVVVEDTNP